MILLHIAEIEERKLFAELGFDGMYSYLTRGLGYSEGSAYRRLQSARLLKQVPSIAEKIENGSLNLSQLTEVQKSLKAFTKNQKSNSSQEYANTDDIKKTSSETETSDSIEKSTANTTELLQVLSKLENKNTFETQKTLAIEMNLPIQCHEKIKPQSDESVRLELTFTKEQFAELEKAKNLLSHICPDGSLAEVITALAQRFNRQKLKDSAKTENAETSQKDSTRTANASEVRKPSSRRKYISIKTKRILLKKANYCCEYVDSKTKIRCNSKHFLEVDHVLPVATGGTNNIDNLRILCRTHNALAARTWGLKLKTC
ncbi:HNH endonuclease [Bdellovibrio sp. 22V]|uniref:HNH endonuclease n=1 Tax=Bdellovibrio sp. 22V TaxID=3044166 RepID=UPI0025437AE1|nr:HNH endonuclease [Bdellovibrio sp. 22V]WII70902.1 HNH endonuclease [Bdellovibrio sp. 22V]